MENLYRIECFIWIINMDIMQGWLKSATLGGSSYKELNPASEATPWPWPLNPINLSPKLPDLA